MRMNTGPWEMSGPEENDTIDQQVFVCNVDADNYEVIKINHPNLTERKAIARKIADLLNQSEAELLSPIGIPLKFKLQK
jgi:hypothetical protein